MTEKTPPTWSLDSDSIPVGSAQKLSEQPFISGVHLLILKALAAQGNPDDFIYPLITANFQPIERPNEPEMTILDGKIGFIDSNGEFISREEDGA